MSGIYWNQPDKSSENLLCYTLKMPKIAVLDYRIPSEVQTEINGLASNKIEFPGERCPENEVAIKIGEADIALITPWEGIDSEILDACPNLKYIGLCGTSTANIDLEEVSRRNIVFTNMKSYKPDEDAKTAGGKQAVAEFFFMQLVQLARGSDKYQWKRGKELQLKNRTIGIIGLGEVGQGIARMAMAYNMNIFYYGPNRKPAWNGKGVIYKEKDDLLKSSDIIVLSSPTNVQVLCESEFNNMKSGSILVQACSGSPFDKPAFYSWIEKNGNYAIFDMSASEKNYELYKSLPGVIFSRQVAGDTYESNQVRSNGALKLLHDYLTK